MPDRLQSNPAEVCTYTEAGLSLGGDVDILIILAGIAVPLIIALNLWLFIADPAKIIWRRDE